MKSPVPRRRRHAGALIAAALLSASLSAPATVAATPAAPTAGAAADAEDGPAYRNTALPFEVRAADLVSRMTRAEKIQQFRAERQHNANVAPAIQRLGVSAYNYWN